MTITPEIQRFVDAARAFCGWAEGKPGEPEVEGRAAICSLVRLYSCALDLPDIFGEEEADRIPDANYRQVFNRFGVLPFNYYSKQFNPLLVPGENPCIADLADDMADIWRDLKPGLKQFDAGLVEAAVWEWRNSFQGHWGHHAASAIFALHCWLTNMPNVAQQGVPPDQPCPASSAGG